MERYKHELLFANIKSKEELPSVDTLIDLTNYDIRVHCKRMVTLLQDLLLSDLTAMVMCYYGALIPIEKGGEVSSLLDCCPKMTLKILLKTRIESRDRPVSVRDYLAIGVPFWNDVWSQMTSCGMKIRRYKGNQELSITLLDGSYDRVLFLRTKKNNFFIDDICGGDWKVTECTYSHVKSMWQIHRQDSRIKIWEGRTFGEVLRIYIVDTQIKIIYFE
jgi:hypothetical protein